MEEMLSHNMLLEEMMDLSLLCLLIYMDNGYGSDMDIITSTTSTSTTISYLVPGVLYKFYLIAENSISFFSKPSTLQLMMAGTVPTSPSQPSLISQSSTSISFYWNEPFDNGGATVTSYTVVITDSLLTVLTFNVIGDTRFVFSGALGLVAAMEYDVLIYANNYITEYSY
jgi:hypothetical protein